MWTDWIPAGILIALIGLGGTLYGVHATRKSAKESNSLKEAEQLAGRVNSLWQRVDKAESEIKEQAEQIRKLQESEWSLRRYIYRLIDRIRALGEEPPEPPDNLNL